MLLLTPPSSILSPFFSSSPWRSHPLPLLHPPKTLTPSLSFLLFISIFFYCSGSLSTDSCLLKKQTKNPNQWLLIGILEPTKGGHSTGSTHVTNLNLNLSAFTENTSLSRQLNTSHNPPTWL